MTIDKFTKVFDLVKKDNGKLSGIHITLKPQAQLPQIEECFSYFATHFLYPASIAFPICKKNIWTYCNSLLFSLFENSVYLLFTLYFG